VDTEYINFVYLVNRYLHIVATALLIGGTLFYELVVPVALDEMRDEQKLWIFARARWAFRWIVWSCVTVLVITGVLSTYRNWEGYSGEEAQRALANAYPVLEIGPVRLAGAGLWWLGHALTALLGVVIAMALVRGNTPPRYPLIGMRISLLVLLVAVFLASTTRHIRVRLFETYFHYEEYGTVD
jgi:hypothetical protein